MKGGPFLAQFLAAGKVTPVIDKQYKLRDAVEAFRYVEKGHSRESNHRFGVS